MDQKEYIGKKIRELRDSMGISAEDLGRMLSPVRSNSTVTSWERGRTQPDADTLIDLCLIFKVEISDFYFKSDEYVSSVVYAVADLSEVGTDVEINEDEARLLSYYHGMTEQGRTALMASAEGLHQAFRAKK